MVIPTSWFSAAAQNADPSRGRYLDRCTHCTPFVPCRIGHLGLAVPGTAVRSGTAVGGLKVVSRVSGVPNGADGCFPLGIDEAAGQAGKSGQLAAFIQQGIRRVYRRQRTAPLLSRTAMSRHQSQ